MTRSTITARGDEMIALIGSYGGIYPGTTEDLANDLAICFSYTTRVMQYIRTNPHEFNDVTIEWNANQAGYGLVVSGVSAFADDGEHLIAELVRVYTTRIGNDNRSLNMVTQLQTGASLPKGSRRLLRATERHLKGTVLQAEALLSMIGP